MSLRTSWLAGVVLLAGAGAASAQTGTPGTTKTFPGYGGPRTATGGLLPTTPPTNGQGVGTGTGQSVGTNGGTGVMTGGGGLVGRPNQNPITPAQDLALLIEARLLVTQLEASGNVTLSHTESMLLTLLVYEALRLQAAHPATGGTTVGSP
jgi:hypothetical protein